VSAARPANGCPARTVEELTAPVPTAALLHSLQLQFLLPRWSTNNNRPVPRPVAKAWAQQRVSFTEVGGVDHGALHPASFDRQERKLQSEWRAPKARVVLQFRPALRRERLLRRDVQRRVRGPDVAGAPGEWDGARTQQRSRISRAISGRGFDLTHYVEKGARITRAQELSRITT
jgi:hypothetical protein